ncbi:MAG: right-handed parallel beta-helix repeat-containing protein [Candidatus Syntrophosphaera sp.]|nr:right-handed parallel beta-helix repeat-containing protein [Candidatus Syntrophosphaera sp.]
MCIIFGMVMLVTCLFAQTTIPPGPVQGNWTAAGSPYLVMGNISIANGASLSIGAGVDVVFQGTFSLAVSGSISTTGSADLPVTFTAQDTLNGWSSIRLSNTGTGLNPPSSFTHTNFLYGRAIWGSGGGDPLNFGGAVWADNAGTLTFDSCFFNRCKSIYDGSAIYADNGTNVVMNNCTVKNCESGFFGGVFVRDGNAEITDCLFDSNVAVTFGAALYFYDSPQANVTSCVISNNVAGAVTGIYGASSNVVVKNSLFAGNDTTMGLGGGMGIIGGSVSLINNTFYGNTSAQGGAAAWFNVLPAPALITNCIFWDNQPDALAANNSSYLLSHCSMQEQEGGATNIFGDPQFTDPAQGILTLMATSPCIDAGTPDATGLGLPDIDLAGMPRIVDGNGDGTPRIDIGCYEWQVPVTDGILLGQVLTSQSEPIEGALIEADGITILSDAAGFYSLTLPAGTYDVSCSKPGYVTFVEHDVSVVAGMTTTLDFYLDIVGNSDEYLVAAIQMAQNTPNPFAGKTSIPFSLDRESRIDLSIYNLKGQKVRTVFSGMARSGEHSADWDGLDDNGRPVERGVYLYRLNIQGRSVTRRLVKL